MRSVCAEFPITFMKTTISSALVIVTSLFLAACGGDGTITVKKVDTKKMEASFQAAPANQKSEMTKAVNAIKSGDFKTATAALKAVIKAGGLSQEQKDAIAQVAAEMQMVASQDSSKYPLELYREIGDLGPLVEGIEPPKMQVMPGRPAN